MYNYLNVTEHEERKKKHADRNRERRARIKEEKTKKIINSQGKSKMLE